MKPVTLLFFLFCVEANAQLEKIEFIQAHEALKGQEYVRAFEIYKRLAEKDSLPEAFSMIGYMYSNGFGVEKNLKSSFYYFSIASDMGDEMGLTNVAFYYLFGLKDIVEKNQKKSYECYLKLAKKGALSSTPYYFLGKITEDGLGIPIDKDNAKDWYKKAIEIGNPATIKQLAIERLQILKNGKE